MSIVKKSNCWTMDETRLLMTDSSGWCGHRDISTDHKSTNRIELSQLGQDLFDCYSFNMTHTSTQSHIHPPICVGVSQQMINFQTELNYLNWVKFF